MTHFNSPFIHYLEVTDFNSSGKLLPSVSPVTGSPVFHRATVLMIQGNFCGYCTQVKPAFTSLASKLANVVDFATIQIDGNEKFSPVFLRTILKSEMQGVPTIALMIEGNTVAIYNGERTEQGLVQWLKSLRILD